MKKWRCNACGYVDKKEEVPVKCPVCQLDSLAFEEIIKKPREERIKKED